MKVVVSSAQLQVRGMNVAKCCMEFLALVVPWKMQNRLVNVLAGQRAFSKGGDELFTGEHVRFEDSQLTLALPFKRKWPLTKCPIKSLSTSGGYY